MQGGSRLDENLAALGADHVAADLVGLEGTLRDGTEELPGSLHGNLLKTRF